jgi:hypothetical protein
MSQDFTFIIAGPDQPISTVLAELKRQLIHLGFARAFSVVRAGIDASRGVFDEVDEEIDAFGSVSTLKDKMKLWEGASIEFWCDDVQLYLLVARLDSTGINCFIDVSVRTITRLFREAKIQKFYAAIIAIAMACRATAGFGDVELPFAPICSEDAIHAIWDNPENVGRAAALGLISGNTIPRAKLKKMSIGKFKVNEWLPGYWLLEGNDYLATYPNLR